MKFYLSVLLIISSSVLPFSSYAQSKNLFNGKDLTGWYIDIPEMDNNSSLKSPFLVREGLLVSMGNEETRG